MLTFFLQMAECPKLRFSRNRLKKIAGVASRRFFLFALELEAPVTRSPTNMAEDRDEDDEFYDVVSKL